MNIADCSSITLGISPCPNDTYIFHALLHGLCKLNGFDDYELDAMLLDVEQLNKLALERKLAVSKLSVGVVAEVMNDYALLSSGGALGWACGPLVVARKPSSISSLRNASIAIPGKSTTANLLLDLHGVFCGERKEMIFNEIIPAVVNGKVDLGVIIHEGRFTYQDYGLTKILDLGDWWESEFAMPIPLGVIAVRRDVTLSLARAIQEAIAQSLVYARANPRASADFIRHNAQEMDATVTSAHIETFVNKFSEDLGSMGRSAIEQLVGHAARRMGKNLPAQGLFLL